jgi:hypothetical protein
LFERFCHQLGQLHTLDPDLKTRLKEALGAAQRSREVLVLELSALPESVQPYQVACSHLLRLVDPKSGFAVIYPYPSRVEMYEEEADNLLDVEVNNQSDASRNLPGAGEFVRGSFLILRPELVASVKTKKTEDQIVKKSAKRKRKDGNEGGSNNTVRGTMRTTTMIPAALTRTKQCGTRRFFRWSLTWKISCLLYSGGLANHCCMKFYTILQFACSTMGDASNCTIDLWWSFSLTISRLPPGGTHPPKESQKQTPQNLKDFDT